MTETHDRFRSLCIPLDASIEDAMRAIDRGAVEIALVVDGDLRLVGTVTDGDIRRALLGGDTAADPVEPHANRSYTAVRTSDDRAYALDLMVSRGLAQLPILDEDRRVTGLHVLKEILGRAPRPETVVIMAGGKGTRLRPVTESIPKPMLKVAGRPILERIVMHLVGFGLRRVYLTVNYHAAQIKDHFGDGSSLGCTISYLQETTDRPQGTAGSLSLLPDDVKQGDHPVLVMNGDLISTFDAAAMLDAHRSADQLVTVGATSYGHDVPYGVLEFDNGVLERVVEKPRVAWPVSAGVNVLSPEAVRMVPSEVRYDITELIEACLPTGRVGVHLIDEEWADIGRPNELREARGER